MNTTALPDVDAAASMLQGAIGQINFARDYTQQLLAATPKELWFEMPNELPTHIGWQVGHIAVSQYGLLMFRIRGREPEDLEIVSGKFRKAYSRQTVPNADTSAQPTADELLERLNQIHKRAMTELSKVNPAVLLEPVDMPYAAYPTKLGAILFCPLHEHIHAGQIGLLRRALGLESVR
jgi:hypothetical protein